MFGRIGHGIRKSRQIEDRVGLLGTNSQVFLAVGSLGDLQFHGAGVPFDRRWNEQFSKRREQRDVRETPYINGPNQSVTSWQ